MKALIFQVFLNTVWLLFKHCVWISRGGGGGFLLPFWNFILAIFLLVWFDGLMALEWSPMAVYILATSSHGAVDFLLKFFKRYRLCLRISAINHHGYRGVAVGCVLPWWTDQVVLGRMCYILRKSNIKCPHIEMTRFYFTCVAAGGVMASWQITIVTLFLRCDEQ